LRLRRSVRQRVLGDATSSIAGIWTGPVVAVAREINQGGSSFCGDCPLKLPLAPDQRARARSQHQRDPQAPLYRVHRRLQHFLQPGGVRA
jgi:hypothetical protein